MTDPVEEPPVGSHPIVAPVKGGSYRSSNRQIRHSGAPGLPMPEEGSHRAGG